MSRFSNHRRTWLLASLVVALVVGAVAVVVNRLPERGASAGGHPAYGPQPDRSVAAIGDIRGQFTDSQFETLASDYGRVYLMGFHGRFLESTHADAARRLHQLDRSTEVFDYFSAKYWFATNDVGFGVGFDPAWYLRDRQGNPVPFAGTNPGAPTAYFADLSNPSYRDWATRLIVGWMRSAPYAGVLLDNADPIGRYVSSQVAGWDRLVGAGKVAAWNEGLTTFLGQVTRALHSMGRQVTYNGISPVSLHGPERNRALLSVTDGAFDEAFCRQLLAAGSNPILPDLDLLTHPAGKDLLMLTVYDTPASRSSGPLCFGSFLMGWTPGSTSYNFAPDYEVDQLDHRLPELRLALGQPSGRYRRSGSVLTRRFAHGFVAVDIGAHPGAATAPVDLVEYRDGKAGRHLSAGAVIALHPHDARFFLDRSYVS